MRALFGPRRRSARRRRAASVRSTRAVGDQSISAPSCRRFSQASAPGVSPPEPSAQDPADLLCLFANAAYLARQLAELTTGFANLMADAAEIDLLRQRNPQHFMLARE